MLFHHSPRILKLQKDQPSKFKVSKSRSPEQKDLSRKLSPNNTKSTLQGQKSTSKSVKYLPKLEKTFEDNLKKLENLTIKNLSARTEWLEIEERLIQLGAKRKLDPIVLKNNRKAESIDLYSPRYLNKELQSSE
jgi:hypothetical protein